MSFAHLEWNVWAGNLPAPQFQLVGEKIIVDYYPDRILFSGALLRGADPELLSRRGRVLRVLADNEQATYRIVRRWPEIDLFGAVKL